MSTNMTMRSSSTASNLNNSSKSTTYKSPTKFIGRLQATTTRLSEKPNVDFAKGGSDFRTPHNTSSIGRQVLGNTGA
jgi:hypothetical protein